MTDQPLPREAEPLTAIDRAIRDRLFATAIREEAELVKELAPSHHCMSNWAGDHCTVCSAHKGTALRTAERFNAYVAAQSADIDRLTRERDGWKRRADAADNLYLAEHERLTAAEELLRVNQDAHKRCDVLMAELGRKLTVAERERDEARREIELWIDQDAVKENELAAAEHQVEQLSRVVEAARAVNNAELGDEDWDALDAALSDYDKGDG